MATAEHPGTVTYVDGDTDRITATKAVADVPEAMRFVDTPAGRVPVVRVVMTAGGGARTIVEYGPDDQVLRSTRQVMRG